MCDDHCQGSRRRDTLKSLAGGFGAVGLGVVSFASSAHAAVPGQQALTRQERDAMTPDGIVEVLKEGNRRFRSGVRKERDFLAEQASSAGGQFPAAMFLSCIDARAPAEILFDLGLGKAFNARIAGNIANEDILGSMEFACKVSGAKLVVVLGHTACGAIKGAIDRVELGNLTGLVNKIQPAVASSSYDGERSTENAAFVDIVARRNVELTIEDIRTGSPILRDLESGGAIKIAGAMYDLGTAEVTFL